MMDGIRYSKISMLTVSLLLSVCCGSFLIDRWDTALNAGRVLVIYFACYSALAVLSYSILVFCEIFGRHGTLATVDVPLNIVVTALVFSGAFLMLLAKQDGIPLIFKVSSLLLLLAAMIAMHLTIYDRKIRKLAPSVTENAKAGDSTVGVTNTGSIVSDDIDIF
jgi:hypothetical protein